MYCDSISSILICFVSIFMLMKIYTFLTMGTVKSNVCLIGKTVLITGGDVGIGYQSALQLASRGARVIIANRKDATLSVENLKKYSNNSNIVRKYVDLSSLESVRQLAKDINDTEERLDILINNAGVIVMEDVYTEDKLQIVMQINHFSGFLLTHLLLDLLKKSAPSRIIFTSSLMAFTNNLSLETLNKTTDLKNGLVSNLAFYGNTKLCNIITANAFAEKLRGTGVTCNSLHPGFVNTDIHQNYSKVYTILPFLMYNFFLKICAKTPHQGAQTTIHCAVSSKLRNTSGKFFCDCMSIFQPPKANDMVLCRRIWEKSEELVGLRPAEKLN